MKKLLFALALLCIMTQITYAGTVLKWDINQDADYYEVGIMDRSANPDGVWPTNTTPCQPLESDNCIMIYRVPANGPSNEVVISDIEVIGEKLKLGNSYEFKVKAFNSCGNSSDWSESVTYTTCFPVQTPSNLGLIETIVPITIIININGEKVSVLNP